MALVKCGKNGEFQGLVINKSTVDIVGIGVCCFKLVSLMLLMAGLVEGVGEGNLLYFVVCRGCVCVLRVFECLYWLGKCERIKKLE